MTRVDKLLERLRRRPPRASFSDVRKLLEAYGWVIANQDGSHVTFKKKGEYPLVIVQESGRRVKRGYVELLLERLGLED
jgi:predicted RNA binding protein YcfA (HicA-like mRNA interferase family)